MRHPDSGSWHTPESYGVVLMVSRAMHAFESRMLRPYGELTGSVLVGTRQAPKQHIRGSLRLVLELRPGVDVE